jgi:hypothetical protein
MAYISSGGNKKATRRNGWPLTIACHMKKEINLFVFLNTAYYLAVFF